MKNDLFFVCGALRSGTSLLHLMLNHHPKIVNPGEFDFFFDKVSDDYTSPKINDYEKWLSTHRIFLSKNLKILNNTQNFNDVLSYFIEQLRVPNKVLAINIHRHFDKILPYFPDAKYVHLIRDPRDVARSSIGMGWAGNVYYGIDHWINSENSWQKLKPSLSKDQYIEIFFEDLIIKPEVTLKNLTEFFEVEYDPLMLSYHQNSTYEKPDITLTYQWEKKLSKKDVLLIESKISEKLPIMGYSLSNYGKLNISVIYRLFLFIQNKLLIFHFSVKRYGLKLVLQERFYRWFHFPHKHAEVKLKSNEIEKRYLK